MTDYAQFMAEYFRDNCPAEFAMMENMPDFEEDLYDEASDAYKLNYYYRDHLQLPKITPVLAKTKVQDSIIEFVGNFIDKHSKELSTAGPVYQITFGATETKFLYETFNTSAEELVDIYNEVVKETYNGSISKFFTGWINNAPHKILLMAMLVDAVQNNYEEMIECIEYLAAFVEYPILYKEFWRTGVKEDVMNYTIEHLSKKFKVRKMANLQELLKYDATKPIVEYKEKLMTGYDNVYLDLLYRLRNQFKSTLRKISREYYKNIENNATQHNNQSVFADGEIADNDGIGANTSAVIDNVINKFSRNEINNNMLKIAAEGSKVDKDNLQNFISQINSYAKNKIPAFIESIITLYFKKFPAATDLGGEFLSYGFSLYRSIASSKDSLLQNVRSILDEWMYDVIDIKSQYNQTTVANYTRAVYNYMILMINYYG